MGSPEPTEHQESQELQNEPNHETTSTSTSSAPIEPPARPKPEDDTGIVPDLKSPAIDDDDLNPDTIDIFTLKPVSALRLLCRNIDFIVHMTGDVPPTPPAMSPLRSMSVPSVERRTSIPFSPRRDSMNQNLHIPGNQHVHEHIDGVPFKRAPIGSPESNLCEPSSPNVRDVGFNAPPIHIQYSALARKFYSKRPPPISTEEYLMRMHKYCPMSTACYIAASSYITKLACVDKIIPVTPRNVHRLLLAGLRVAMKALEDLSWPHARFAKVGGVSEVELGRLEISFCFLMDFGLKVNAETLQHEAQGLCRATDDNSHAVLDSPDDVRKMELKIPEMRIKNSVGSNSGMHTPSRTPEKRKASMTLPNRPAFGVEAGGIEVMGQS